MVSKTFRHAGLQTLVLTPAFLRLNFIDELEKQLSSSQFLYDDEISALDISILPFIRQFRIADMDWFDSLAKPNIQNWLMKFLESKLFKSIMIKYDKWEEGDEKNFFPN